MPMSFAFVSRVILASLLLSSSLHAAQQSQPPSPAASGSHSDSKPDLSKYSKEPIVIEDMTIKVRWESDGRGTMDQTIRERIQAESAVTSEGVLPFQYDSDNQILDIRYVRVRKPDGSVVETPIDSAQDLTSEITRSAPMYTDLREKHVAVRGLSVGDVLETHYVVTVTKPLAPGQFWSSHSFIKAAITLHEEFDVDVPADRTIKLHASLVKPRISESAGRRIYTFEHTNLSKPADPDKFQAIVDGEPYPDVELSSFTSWDQVAAWYGSLQKPRVQVTPEIQAKAQELTRDKKTEDEKVQALYNYVSEKFRYIGVSFGVGRYQPHAASEVLANGFGDCKDKHTLFASLLQAVGVSSYPVLIHSSIKLDPNVPTPAVFDHLITAIPNGDKFTWLDTTPGAAPFAVLMPPLRDKLALIVMDNNKGLLTSTPKISPFNPYDRFTMDATLTKDGVLDGDARLESRGDSEILLRLAFRNTPESKWKDLVQVLSRTLGFGGTVDEIKVMAPDDTSLPFWITYKYHRTDFGDWPNHQITMPFPYFLLPQLSPEEEKVIGAVPLGEIKELKYEVRLTLPPGFTPAVPDPVHESHSAMQYDSTYQLSGSVLEGTRKLSILQQNLAPGDRRSYVAFNKTISDDESRWVVLTTQSLPPRFQSSNPDLQKLLAEAYDSLQAGAPHAASATLQKAIDIDPKAANTWFILGYARSTEHQNETAIMAFRQAIALNPTDVEAYNALAAIQVSLGKWSMAVQDYRDCLTAVPDEHKTMRALGNLLIQMQDFAAARPIFEKLSDSGSMPPVTYELAQTYLRVGEQEKGMKLLQQMLDADSGGENLNFAAWALVEANYKLPEALNYSEKSVHEIEEETSHDPNAIRGLMYNLSARWDTLGWIYFQMGNLDPAERYLSAAWKVWPNAETGSHLGDLYAKKYNQEKAIRMYWLALACLNANDFRPIRDKLNAKTAQTGHDPKYAEQLQSRRAYNLKYSFASEKSADFLIDVARDTQSDHVTLVSGDDGLRKLIPMIAALKFDLEFPDDAPTHLYQTGTLHCSAVRHDCTLVLSDPPAKRPTPKPEPQPSVAKN